MKTPYIVLIAQVKPTHIVLTKLPKYYNRERLLSGDTMLLSPWGFLIHRAY